MQDWALQKNFHCKDDGSGTSKRRGRCSETEFHTEKHSNETHKSKTDGYARLAKKVTGKKTWLSYIHGHGQPEWPIGSGRLCGKQGLAGNGGGLTVESSL